MLEKSFVKSNFVIEPIKSGDTMKIQPQFTEVISLIKQARSNAFKAVNTELISLYWEIGKHITQRTASEGWGKSTVQQLADFIQKQEPELKGFSDKNLWRMKQFFDAYKDLPKLATLWRVYHGAITD